MGEAAIAIAKAVDYDNAGTVEFLLDQDGAFYFIEMNPRLQVEHTVTEQITAIDIVRNQISIAAGKPLDIQQKDVTLQGHAIQCRINAEDPKNNFMPCTGTVTAYLSPGGIGVRIDGAVYKDYTVPPYYDALLAKLTVRGRTWEETVSRMRRSLEEYVLARREDDHPVHESHHAGPGFSRRALRYLLSGDPSRPLHVRRIRAAGRSGGGDFRRNCGL